MLRICSMMCTILWLAITVVAQSTAASDKQLIRHMVQQMKESQAYDHMVDDKQG